MGYTHYFTLKKSKNTTASAVEVAYQRALKDCNKIIRYYYKENKGTEASLSGYSAHASNYGGISFNGARGNGCEDFVLREHFSQNNGFKFCKTRQRYYDTVVVACLIVLKFYLKDNISVESDGRYFGDFFDGFELANIVLKRTKNKMPIPFSYETELSLLSLLKA